MRESIQLPYIPLWERLVTFQGVLELETGSPVMLLCPYLLISWVAKLSIVSPIISSASLSWIAEARRGKMERRKKPW